MLSQILVSSASDKLNSAGNKTRSGATKPHLFGSDGVGGCAVSLRMQKASAKTMTYPAILEAVATPNTSDYDDHPGRHLVSNYSPSFYFLLHIFNHDSSPHALLNTLLIRQNECDQVTKVRSLLATRPRVSLNGNRGADPIIGNIPNSNKATSSACKTLSASSMWMTAGTLTRLQQSRLYRLRSAHSTMLSVKR